jgi:ribosomal protein S18 acetylase RimI-like enzyme
MEIRKAKKEDFKSCLAISRSLPEWFEEKELSEIHRQILSLPTYLIEDVGILAFVIIEDKDTETVEIKHLAVSRDHQRSGLGTKLLEYIEKEYSKKTYVEVKTLDESAEYEPYVSTRSFYEKNGFTKVKVIDPYPGWSLGNPCAVYRKSI